MTQEDSRIDQLLDRLRDRCLPVAAEIPLSFLSCLSVGCVYGSIYIWRQWRLARHQGHLPLMTHVKSETKPSLESLEALLCEKLGVDASETTINDDRLVQRIRSDPSLGRRASQYMIMSTERDAKDRSLHRILDRLWPRLLELPPIPSADEYPYKLSLILPAFRETNAQVASTLQRAYKTSMHPEDVQVIVVDAGYCSPDLVEYLLQHTQWSTHNLQVISTGANTGSSGSGRGFALNFGAKHATARVLFFLHSDTRTPHAWDGQILEQFDGLAETARSRKVHATCFKFAFDKSGLTTCNTMDTRPAPSYMALLPVKWMVNLRTRFCKLPYGDQGIAMPAAYFVHIGGFPAQPIMEDYSLMDYLRLRALCLPERLVVLDASCQVSVRRWQRVGTVYMTLANALIVFRYNFCGWTPADVFDYYYKRPQRIERAT